MSDDSVIVRTIEPSKESKRQLKLFENYLRKDRHPIDLVKRIYKFIDKMVVADGIASQSACKASCSKCCELPIDITKAEAYVIGMEYGIEAKNFSMEPHYDTTKYEALACPFLLDNRCQIYDVRPIVCRAFHVMEETSINCGPGKKSTTFGIRSSSAIQQLFDLLASDNSSLEGGGDIRYFFGEETIIIKE